MSQGIPRAGIFSRSLPLQLSRKPCRLILGILASIGHGGAALERTVQVQAMRRGGEQRPTGCAWFLLERRQLTRRVAIYTALLIHSLTAAVLRAVLVQRAVMIFAALRAIE